MKTLLVDYQMGNLGSVRRALEECGADVICSDNPKDLRLASSIVLPGVGSFRDGMTHLKQCGWEQELRIATLEDKIPLLGICLGMQLLSSKGFENGETEGLGLIPGTVNKLIAETVETRIPHVGWNEVATQKQSILFTGVPNRSDFYFVHSYQFLVDDTADVVATTPHGGDFVSAIARENIFGTQFHPEKSSKAGFQLIRNFLKFTNA